MVKKLDAIKIYENTESGNTAYKAEVHLKQHMDPKPRKLFCGVRVKEEFPPTRWKTWRENSERESRTRQMWRMPTQKHFSTVGHMDFNKVKVTIDRQADNEAASATIVMLTRYSSTATYHLHCCFNNVNNVVLTQSIMKATFVFRRFLNAIDVMTKN